MKDSLSTIFTSAAHFLTGTAISRLTGLLRDISIAFSFGATKEVAAFLVAFRLSHLARRLLGEGALQQAFIPLFEEMRREDEEKALSFFLSLARGLSFLLVGLVLLSSVVLFSLEHFLGEENQEIAYLTLLMLPSLIFICLFGLNASLLQCERKYFAPAIAPVAFNLVWVLGAYLFQEMPLTSAMRWMALMINAACVGQWALTLPFLRKQLNAHSPLPGLFPKELKKLIRRMGLGILGVGAVQINNAVDPLFARFADLTGPAYLWFAIRIEQFPLGVFALALSTALLPPLSRAIRRQDKESFITFLLHALKKSAGLMIPLSFLMIQLASPLIALVYGYGEFDQDSIERTANCLMAYTLGLAPSTFVLLLASGFYSQHDYKTPALGSLYTMVSNFLTNTLFVFGFGFGAVSVALSTSISAFGNAIYLFHKHECPTIVPNLCKLSGASLFAYLGAYSLEPVLDLAAYHPVFTLLATSAVFLLFLALGGWALKCDELLFWKTEKPLRKEPSSPSIVQG